MKTDKSTDPQYFLKKIEEIKNETESEQKIRKLLEQAIRCSSDVSDILEISESIKIHLNDLKWIRRLLNEEQSRLNRVHLNGIYSYSGSFEVVLDYVILGDGIAKVLNDKYWALSCYKKAEKYACSVWDYFLIGNSVFENLSEHERTIEFIGKAYKLVETQENNSTVVTLLANLIFDVTGDKKRATELYNKALAIDESGGICRDDRLFISRSIEENLKDHKWSRSIRM